MKAHCMIDLETLGSLPGSVITSIGAVAFTQAGNVALFYQNVSIDSCLRLGLTAEGGALKFWFTETTEEARRALFDPPVLGLREALHAFNGFFAENGCNWLWSHGADFDIPALSCAYAAAGYNSYRPWKFRNDRDTRTLYSLLPKGFPEVGVININKHNALADAVFQAECVRQAYEELGRCLPEE